MRSAHKAHKSAPMVDTELAFALLSANNKSIIYWFTVIKSNRNSIAIVTILCVQYFPYVYAQNAQCARLHRIILQK